MVECAVYSRNKGEKMNTPGLLQPLPILDQRWEEISMDFITGIPKSEGKDTILVMVNKLTKYAHFYCIQTTYKASQIAEVFSKVIQKLHGIPKVVVSDRDPKFISNFWMGLFKTLGT